MLTENNQSEHDQDECEKQDGNFYSFSSGREIEFRAIRINPRHDIESTGIR